ncbi:hypothetical protein D9M71_242280 [compost metagenome]
MFTSDHGDFLGDHYLGVGENLEQRRVDPRHLAQQRFQPQLVLPAAGRLQVEVEAFQLPRGIGHFRLGRRLEALAGADVAVQLRAEGIHHPQRRHVLLEAPRSAGIAVGEEMVVHLHLHAGAADAGQQGPVAKHPVGLHIGIEAAGGVQLVAAQGALHAELVAIEVPETAAIVLAPVVIDAEGQAQLARNALQRLQPAQAAAVEVAVEIHHPAAAKAIGDGGGRDGEELQHAAPAGVGGELQAGRAELALVVQAELLVVDALARVEQPGVGRDRTRVGVEACPGLPQRVLGAVLLQGAGDQRQTALVVGPEVELGEGLVAARGAVVAVAVGVQARGVQHEARVAGVVAALGVDMVALQLVAAEQAFRADARRALAVAGEHLDHPAGVAAVERRGRTAQHLEALGDVEVEGRRLALAIRRAGRDAIHQQLDAAHAEGRARAEASGGNLQVLGVVLAVLHHQPGHAGQGFRGVDAQLTLGDLPAVDAVHRGRLVEAAAQAVAAGDHHRIELGALLRLSGQREGRAKQRHACRTLRCHPLSPEPLRQA